MDGILVIDKPAGPTSFQVVARVRAALGLSKVGHTGTLDPAATGVLPLCLGAATRVAGYLTEGDKAYQATLRLGVSTDTQDATGKVLSQREVPPLAWAEVEAALASFRGRIQQVPPMYSAVKQGGKRLYALARKGEEVERAPREVIIRELKLLDLQGADLKIYLECTKGTYVRTLAHDLGEKLGPGGHLLTLRRTRSGRFTLADAVPLQALLDGEREAANERLVPLADAFADWEAVKVDAATLAHKVGHGQPLPTPASLGVAEGERVRVLGPDNALVALAERRGPLLRYLRVLGP